MRIISFPLFVGIVRRKRTVLENTVLESERLHLYNVWTTGLFTGNLTTDRDRHSSRDCDDRNHRNHETLN